MLQADAVEENQKLILQVEHLELLHYQLKFQVLECESILSSLQSQYTQDLPDPNIQDARDVSLLLSQVRTLTTGDRTQKMP